MAPNTWQAIIWTNDDPVHRRVYGAQGGDELSPGYDCGSARYLHGYL